MSYGRTWHLELQSAVLRLRSQMAEMGHGGRTLQSHERLSEHFRVSDPKPRGADRTYIEHCLLK